MIRFDHLISCRFVVGTWRQLEPVYEYSNVSEADRMFNQISNLTLYTAAGLGSQMPAAHARGCAGWEYIFPPSVTDWTLKEVAVGEPRHLDLCACVSCANVLVCSPYSSSYEYSDSARAVKYEPRERLAPLVRRTRAAAEDNCRDELYD